MAAVIALICLDKLVDDGEERRVFAEALLIVDRLAKALEVFWANVAKERRLRREIEPTTDPENVIGKVGGSVVGILDEEESARGREREGSGTEGRDSSREWFTDGRVGIE